jgi:hypothetical protein
MERWLGNQPKRTVAVEVADNCTKVPKSTTELHSFAKTVLHFCGSVQHKDLNQQALKTLPKFTKYLLNGLTSGHDDVLDEIKATLEPGRWSFIDRPSRKRFLNLFFSRIGFPEIKIEEMWTAESNNESKSNEESYVVFNLSFEPAERVSMPRILGKEQHLTDSSRIRHQFKIQNPLPQMFLVSLERVYPSGTTIFVDGLKETITLSTVNECSVTYEPIAIICEEPTENSVRYYCFRKNEDKWFHCGNSTFPEERYEEIILKFGSFVLYRSTSYFIEGIIQALTSRVENGKCLLYHDADCAWEKLDLLKNERDTLYQEIINKQQLVEIVHDHLTEESVTFDNRNSTFFAVTSRVAEKLVQPLSLVPVPSPIGLGGFATAVSKISFYANEIISKRNLDNAKKLEKRVNEELAVLEERYKEVEKDIATTNTFVKQLEVNSQKTEEARTLALGALFQPNSIPHSTDQESWRSWAQKVARNVHSTDVNQSHDADKFVHDFIHSGIQSWNLDQIIFSAWQKRLCESMTTATLLNRGISLESALLVNLKKGFYDDQRQIEEMKKDLEKVSMECNDLEASLLQQQERSSLRKRLNELRRPSSIDTLGIDDGLSAEVESNSDAAVRNEDRLNVDLKTKKLKEADLASTITDLAQKASETFRELQCIENRLVLAKQRAEISLETDLKVKNSNWPDMKVEVDLFPHELPVAIDPPLLSVSLAIRLGNKLETNEDLDADEIDDTVFLDFPHEWDEDEVKCRIDAFEVYLNQKKEFITLVLPGLGDSASTTSNVSAFGLRSTFHRQWDERFSDFAGSVSSSETDQTLRNLPIYLSKSSDMDRAALEWIKILSMQTKDPLLELVFNQQRSSNKFIFTPEQGELLELWGEKDQETLQRRQKWEMKRRKCYEHKLNADRCAIAETFSKFNSRAHAEAVKFNDPSSNINEKYQALIQMGIADNRAKESEKAWRDEAEKIVRIAALSGDKKKLALEHLMLEDNQQNQLKVWRKCERCAEQYFFSKNGIYWKRLTVEERVSYNFYVEAERNEHPQKCQRKVQIAGKRIEKAKKNLKETETRKNSVFTKFKLEWKWVTGQDYESYCRKYDDFVKNAKAELEIAETRLNNIKETLKSEDKAIAVATQHCFVADLKRKDTTFDYHNIIKGLEDSITEGLKKVYTSYQEIGDHNLREFNRDWDTLFKQAHMIETMYTKLKEMSKCSCDESKMDQEIRQYWEQQIEICDQNLLQYSLYAHLYPAKKMSLLLELQVKEMVNTAFVDRVQHRSRWNQIQVYFEETFEPAWKKTLLIYLTNPLLRSNFWIFKIKEVQFMYVKSKEQFLRRYEEFKHEEIHSLAEEKALAFDALHINEDEVHWMNLWEDSLAAWDAALTSSRKLESDLANLISDAEKVQQEVEVLLLDSPKYSNEFPEILKSKISSWVEEKWKPVKVTWDNERLGWLQKQKEYTGKIEQVKRKKGNQWMSAVQEFADHLEMNEVVEAELKRKQILRFPTFLFTPKSMKDVLVDNVIVVNKRVKAARNLQFATDLSESEREIELQNLKTAETERKDYVEWVLLPHEERRWRYEKLKKVASAYDTYTLRKSIHDFYKESKPECVVHMHDKVMKNVETSCRNWLAVLQAVERGYDLADCSDNLGLETIVSYMTGQRKDDSERCRNWWRLKWRVIQGKYDNSITKKAFLGLYSQVNEAALTHFLYELQGYQSNDLLASMIQIVQKIIVLEQQLVASDENVRTKQNWIYKAFWNLSSTHNDKKESIMALSCDVQGKIAHQKLWDKIHSDCLLYIGKVEEFTAIDKEMRKKIIRWWEKIKDIAENNAFCLYGRNVCSNATLQQYCKTVI